MILSNILFSTFAGTATLSADITFRGKKTERAFISTSAKNNAMIIPDASPFLAAVLLPCMKTGESILVEGTVAKDLLKHSEKIMQLVASWNIGLKPVAITATAFTKTKPIPNARGSFFTAGVDSFYTYLKHRKTRQPITHLILAHGFDVPLSNTDFFTKVAKTVTTVAKREGIAALLVKTNIGEIIEKRLIWDYAHGGALAAVGYFFRGGLKSLYIPGAVRDDQLFPYGTHPHLDRLWSTSTMTVKSDGGEYDRIQKITNSIAKSPLALQYLRVCTQNIKGKYNCSRCYKCLITMIYLTCADALKNAKTFDRQLDSTRVKNMYYDYYLKYNIQGEMGLSLLKERSLYPELQEAIAYSLEKSKRTKLLKQLAKRVAAWDQRYNDRRLYQLIFRMNKNQDRNFLFTFLFKKGLLK